MTERILNRAHPDACCVEPRCECPAPRVTARLDASCGVDRFEAQAQTDIAEVTASA